MAYPGPLGQSEGSGSMLQQTFLRLYEMSMLDVLVLCLLGSQANGPVTYRVG